MKTILACTDFSPSGENAVRYAAALARETGAELCLFHVCHLPVITGEAPLMAYSVEDVEKDARVLLSKEAAGVEKIFGIRPRVLVITGLASDEILDAAKTEEADLIVLGTVGVGNSPGAFGGVVYEVMHSGQRPVLAVPPGFPYRPLRKIALATDLHKDEHPQYDLLRRLVNHFAAKVFLVSLLKPHEQPTVEQAVAGVQLDHDFSDINHEMVLLESENVEEGLGHFVEDMEMDLLAVLPHRHNIFRRLFGGTHTQKILKYTHVPLLALPEEHK